LPTSEHYFDCHGNRRRETNMRFVAAVLLAVTVVGGASAIHPPMETPGQQTSTQQTSTTSGGGGNVHITSVSTPEPSAVTLALFALAGGSTCGLLRRKR
jgi:hypothetical protein